MKNYPLSTFQKEQYTQYLETQLQKFSAFMLSQKKENQRYHILENVIDKQNSQITKLSQKMRMLELFQKQNYRHSQKMENFPLKANDLDHRLKKVQSMYFERQIQKQNYSSERNSEDLRIVRDQMNKKIKILEKEVKKVVSLQSQNQQKTKYRQNNENSPIATNHSEVLSTRTQNFASKYDLKKMEDKLHGFFEKNFNKIERMIRKSVNKSAKKDDQKSKKSKMSEDIYIQEQTFGHSYKNYNDYEMNNQKSSHDRSVANSDTSGRLYPVQYYSQKQVQKEQEKRKSRKRISRSRSLPKQKSKSVKSRSASRSLSRSKSIRRKNKEKKQKKFTLKTPNRKSEQKSKSREKLNSIKEYKKSCKKKHF